MATEKVKQAEKRFADFLVGIGLLPLVVERLGWDT